jgi:autotransporter-associated beta strand protein
MFFLAVSHLMPHTDIFAATWITPGSASWTNSTNWSGNAIPDGVQDSADFDQLDLLSDIAITLDGAKTVGSLTFGDTNPSHDWSIRGGSGGSGGALTLDVTTGTPTLSVNSRTATLGIPLVGNKGLLKTGPGTLVLSGPNSYSGRTTVAMGVLRICAPAVFPVGFQIMPLGDSITYGSTSNTAGYRGALFPLVLPMAPTFRFIGTSNLGSTTLPSSPIDQRYHEGHSSYNLNDVSNNLDGFDNARFLQYGGQDRNPNGGYWLTGGNGTGRSPVNPDCITMMLGTNDLLDQDGVEARLQGLISKITTLRPNSRLIIAKITPITSGIYPIDSYNSIVTRQVAAFQAAGKNVHLVDLNSGFPGNGLINDGVHPNDTGFAWMARQWHEAIIDAFTPQGVSSQALPANGAVTVMQGATLDLNGNKAFVSSLANSGTLRLGSGGGINAFAIQLLGQGQITGSGTVGGSVGFSGSQLGIPGQSLDFTGIFTNNGTIHGASSASLKFSGALINNGTIGGGPDNIPLFPGAVTNNGVIRVTDGATLENGGTFTNNGVLDLITGAQDLPRNFVNYGVVLDSSELKNPTISIAGSFATVTIPSNIGHGYQLQYSPSLEPGSWQNEGPSKAGLNGLLSFTIPLDPVLGRGFYRVHVSP